jgi:hypothetical protein
MMERFALASAIGVGLLASGAAAPLNKPSATVPSELRGNWHEADNYEAPICSDDDQGLLQITDKDFTYPLEFGRVTRVTEVEPNRWRVDFMETALSDDPRAKFRPTKQVHHWTLSHDAEHLAVNTGSAVYDLFRCRPQPTK